jgi:SAM-dependent methyltransferase
MTNPNARFDGSIPGIYDRHLGPFLFEPYARDLVSRLPVPAPPRVLEIACGTGIVTAALCSTLPAHTELVATDLNEAMIALARNRLGGAPNVTWRTADASALPFQDTEFDLVVCQFGLMFFPDKLAAVREFRRVLRRSGRLLLNVWDSLAENPIGRIAHETISAFFPGNPPDFFQVPYGLADRSLLGRLIRDGGFEEVRLEVVSLEGTSESARHAAYGLLHGNPMSAALRERGVSDSGPLVEALTAALAAAGGSAPLRLPMRAIVIEGRAV